MALDGRRVNDAFIPVQLARPEGTRYFNEALARGLSVLLQFDEERQWLTLSDIARSTGMNRTTALRMVTTLEAFGFLERSERTRRYRPGLAVLKLGHAAIRSFGFRDLALPYLEDLSRRTSETVNMGVLVGAEVVYLERIKRTELVTASIHVGSRLPAYTTSIGKALLAHLSDERLDELLVNVPLEPRGPNTITSPTRLRKALAEVRELGYAVQDEEAAAGLRSVAAVIRDQSGKVVAAINIAVPAARVTRATLIADLGPEVVATAELISRASGFVESVRT